MAKLCHCKSYIDFSLKFSINNCDVPYLNDQNNFTHNSIASNCLKSIVFYLNERREWGMKKKRSVVEKHTNDAMNACVLQTEPSNWFRCISYEDDTF